MIDRSQFIGRLAGVTQILFAVLIGGVASLAAEPGFLPRGVVLLALFALPGLVGLIGASARRPWLLVAAGLASAAGSVLSIVTLIFLVPAGMFLVGAVRLVRPVAGTAAASWAGGLAQLGIAVAIVVLVVGAGVAALVVTDSGCWTKYETATGVRIETGPYSTGEIEVPSGASAAGCSTGLISVRGAGMGAALGGAAVVLALLAARRRQPVPSGANVGAGGA